MAAPEHLVEAARAELRARQTPGTDSHARASTLGWAAKGPPTELGRCIFQRWQEDLAARMDVKAEEYVKRGRDGTMTVVLIDAPPQVGKSEVVSRRAPTRFMAQLGLSVGIASYSASLAKTHGRKAREMLRSQEARHLWPFLWEAAPKGLAETDTAEEWTIASPHDGRKGARMKVAGRGGGLTGYPFDIIVLDDMYKDMTDYSSAANRRQVSDFLSSQVVARLAERGGLVFDMGTRWGTQDTKAWWLGKVEELRAQGQEIIIEHWSYPLKAKPGDTLGREVGEYLTENWSREKEDAMRAMYGRHAKAILDCDPVDHTGGMLQRAWYDDRYTDHPLVRAQGCETQIITIDNALGVPGGDWTRMQVWGKAGEFYYLLGQKSGRMGMPEQVNAAIALFGEWPKAKMRGIEWAPPGIALYQELTKRGYAVQKLEHGGKSKVVRAERLAVASQALRVKLPTRANAPWVEDFVDELVSFDPDVKDQTDDQVDAAAYAVAYFEGAAMRRVTRSNRVGWGR